MLIRNKKETVDISKKKLAKFCVLRRVENDVRLNPMKTDLILSMFSLLGNLLLESFQTAQKLLQSFRRRRRRLTLASSNHCPLPSKVLPFHLTLFEDGLGNWPQPNLT